MIRSLFFLVFSLVLAGGSFYLYLLSGPEVQGLGNPVEGIPTSYDELVVIDYPTALHTKIENQQAYAEFHPSIPLVSSLLEKYTAQVTWFEEKPFYFVQSADTLFGIFSLPQNWRQQEQESWLVKTLGATPISSGNLLIENKQQLSLRVTNDLCFFGEVLPKKIPLRDGESLDERTVSTLRQFGKADLNQFIPNHRIDLPIVGALSNQVIRDVQLGNQQLSIEAIITLDDSKLQLNALPENWSAYLPGDLIQLHGIGTKSGYELLGIQMKRMDQSALATFNGELAQYESNAGLSMQDLLEPWWNGGTLAFDEQNGGNYMLFGSVDQTVALSSLNQIHQSEEEPLLEGRLVTWSSTDTLINHIFSLLGNRSFSSAWVLEDAVVFGEARENLVHLASTLAIGQGLETDHPVVRALKRGEHFIQYGVANKSAARGLNLPAFETIDATPIHSVYGGTSMKDGRFVTRYDLGTDERTAAAIFMEWESTLPTLRTETIQSIKNHNNGEYYVVIQDLENALHAVDARGRKMWSYSLNAPINSTIEAIDLYKNGKYQLAFTTTEGLYCLDLRGENVSGFPVTSSSTITCPLYIADYDNNKNYRFLFGTADGKLHNYHDEGEKTSGWKYNGEGNVTSHCEHIKAGNKDYLFVAYQNRDVRLLKRNGKDRYTTRLTLPKEAKDFAFQMTGDISTSSITMIDSMNVVLEARFGNGVNPETTELAEAFGILLSDLDRDRLNDLVLSKKDGIAAYRSDHSLLFERSFETSPLPELRAYSFATGLKVGVVLPETTQLFLIGIDGSTEDGFPLYGASPFVIRDLDQDGNMELITTDGKNLVLCYQL